MRHHSRLGVCRGDGRHEGDLREKLRGRPLERAWCVGSVGLVSSSCDRRLHDGSSPTAFPPRQDCDDPAQLTRNISHAVAAPTKAATRLPRSPAPRAAPISPAAVHSFAHNEICQKNSTHRDSRGKQRVMKVAAICLVRERPRNSRRNVLTNISQIGIGTECREAKREQKPDGQVAPLASPNPATRKPSSVLPESPMKAHHAVIESGRHVKNQKTRPLATNTAAEMAAAGT